jgi:hypothetical protein
MTASKKKAAPKKKSKTAVARPRGRPSGYSDFLADEICHRLTHDGGRSLRNVCAADDMPSLSMVMRWLVLHDYFREQYAIAMDVRAEIMADDMLEIADDGRNDYVQTDDGLAVDKDHIQRSRLRVDTRKWLLAKMAPKKYGDKVTQEVTGPGGGPVQYSEVPTRDYNDIRRKIAERRAATAHN